MSQNNQNTRVKVQQFGRFLSGMVLPNIGAFIAWGLITSLFIPTGWLPNEELAKLVGPMITFLLPLLIGYTGGTMVHGTRGGVIGAVVTAGIIVGASVPMFLGAMFAGPAAAWVLKKFDKAVEGKIPAGFEMLVNNFSSGIIGAGLALIGFKGIAPILEFISNTLKAGVDFLVNNHLLYLANILIEPGKILFLNNAINHGVLTPIASEQVLDAGKSVIFMLESNPGPGLGILIAYYLFGKGIAKQSAPSSMIIHFFGGIHEIYFPYVLMKPRLILAVIAGGITGTTAFSLFGVGLTGAPSPGSIFAYTLTAAKGDLLLVYLGVLLSAAVSAFVASILLKTSKDSSDDLEAAQEQSRANKAAGNITTALTDVRKIVFACDAGMGSSAMGASILRKKVEAAGLKISVTNTAISDLPSDANIVFTHASLTDRARAKVPTAEHISIDNFLSSPAYDQLVNRLK